MENKMKKIISMLCLVVMTSILFVGCGKETTQPKQETKQETKTAKEILTKLQEDLKETKIGEITINGEQKLTDQEETTKVNVGIAFDMKDNFILNLIGSVTNKENKIEFTGYMEKEEQNLNIYYDIANANKFNKISLPMQSISNATEKSTSNLNINYDKFNSECKDDIYTISANLTKEDLDNMCQTNTVSGSSVSGSSIDPIFSASDSSIKAEDPKEYNIKMMVDTKEDTYKLLSTEIIIKDSTETITIQIDTSKLNQDIDVSVPEDVKQNATEDPNSLLGLFGYANTMPETETPEINNQDITDTSTKEIDDINLLEN